MFLPAKKLCSSAIGTSNIRGLLEKEEKLYCEKMVSENAISHAPEKSGLAKVVFFFLVKHPGNGGSLRL